MPQSYRIDTAQRLIWTRCWGILADSDLAEHQAKIRVDPAFSPTLGQLVDTREVREVAITLPAARALGHSKLFSPESRRAYVVRDDVMYGLARMYELYQELRGTRNVRVFRDRAEAVTWLGVTDPTPDAANPHEAALIT